MKRFVKFVILVMLCNMVLAHDLISLFPIENYNQDISSWIKPADPDYDRPLISSVYQQERYDEFYEHYYASDPDGLSPWSRDFVNGQLVQADGKDIITLESQILVNFYIHGNNPKKTGYGMNYRPYATDWYQKLADSMSLGDNVSLTYIPENRAIAVTNLYIRALPTMEPLFYDHKIAGEGYPFDNLQETALFTGMPVYIVKQTADKAWSLVIASDANGWVQTSGIAKVNDKFIKKWQKVAEQGLIAITKQDSLVDKHGLFRGTAYNGSSLPLLKDDPDDYSVLVPVAGMHGNAHLAEANISTGSAVKMPLALTPHNMASIMQNQIGKPYGWGNMLFNYDCSAETKALFTPFAIYLPRNSQSQSDAGSKVVELDKLNATEREQYLLAHGHKFVTLVQIPGHILLYIGSYPNPYSKKHEPMAMSYQNIWGLRTPENDFRSIIGGSVIFPLLEEYPENSDFVSIYDQKARPKFRLIYLDEDSHE